MHHMAVLTEVQEKFKKVHRTTAIEIHIYYQSASMLGVLFCRLKTLRERGDSRRGVQNSS